MIFKDDSGLLVDHATETFYGAAKDTLDVLKDIAPRVSGDYAGSLKMWRRKRAKGPTATIGTRKVPYGNALEFGAVVRHGRGPHIRRADAPKPVQRAAESFPSLYESRLITTPIGSG